MNKKIVKLSSSFLCYDFGQGQWSHCTQVIKEVRKQKDKSTDSKELAGEQDLWGTWNEVHLDLLCQNSTPGLQHPHVILCQIRNFQLSDCLINKSCSCSHVWCCQNIKTNSPKLLILKKKKKSWRHYLGLLMASENLKLFTRILSY